MSPETLLTANSAIQPNVEGLVDVTDSAAEKMRQILQSSGQAGIRLGVVGGGCAGLQYQMEPCDAPAAGDLIQASHNLHFFIHPMAAPYLKDMRVDYSNAMMDGGFKFTNPNATNTCGCGTSFGI